MARLPLTTLGMMPAADARTLERRRILDFGCGTGWVLAKVPADRGNSMLVGLDFSLAKLIEGRRQFQGLCFVAGSGLTLPFADASFDEVIGHVSMPYMNTSAALREIHRVLAPGGTFFLTFHSVEYVRQRLLRSLRRGLWRDVLLMFYTIANGFLNHCGLPQIPWFRGNFETINTPAGIERTARKIGFSEVRIERQPGLIFFGVIGRKLDPQCHETPPDPGWSLDTVISDGSPESAVPVNG